MEINNTFYRMPKPAVLASWSEQVPDSFVFALEASRRITHRKRLEDAEEEVTYPYRLTSAPFGYLRLRRPEYGAADLERWVPRIRAQPWQHSFVFFEHEDAGIGPGLAACFRDLFAARVPRRIGARAQAVHLRRASGGGQR